MTKLFGLFYSRLDSTFCLNRDLSLSFMVVNVFCTVFVVAIHNNSLSYIGSSGGYNLNYYIQQFFVNGVFRSAVPVFAFLSGFFVLFKLVKLSYFLFLKDKLKTLVLPYVLVSFILLISVQSIKCVATKGCGFVGVEQFFYELLIHPVAIQFWFLRDLILISIISPIVVFARGGIFCLIGLLLGVLWLFDLQVFPIVGGWYLINIEVIFFFWAGVGFARYFCAVNFCHVSNRFVFVLLVVWFLLIFVRIFLDHDLDVWYVKSYTFASLFVYKLYIAIGVFCLFCVAYKFRMSKSILKLSGLTFFVYVFHTVPVSYISHVVAVVTPKEYGFYINFPLILFLVFCVAYFVCNKTPGFFSLITGGRNLDKILNRIS